jgi:MtN3 and saliva related transmembrane protein
MLEFLSEINPSEWVDTPEEIVSLIGATLTTSSFVPQALKTLRTKDTSGISATTYTMFCIGVAFWTVFGFMLESPQIYIANSITLALATTILVLKFRYG